METSNEIILRPVVIYAFIKVTPIILLAFAFLLLAWSASPWFLLVSFLLSLWSCYRFIYIRKLTYRISPKVITCSRGIFFRRVDQVEISRLKDYIIYQSAFARLFRIMDLTLKSTGPKYPVIHLCAIPESDIVELIRGYVLDEKEREQNAEIN